MSAGDLDGRTMVGLRPRVMIGFITLCGAYVVHSLVLSGLGGGELAVETVAAVMGLSALAVAALVPGATLPVGATAAGTVLMIAAQVCASTNWDSQPYDDLRYWPYLLFMLCQAIICLRGRPLGTIALQLSMLALFLTRSVDADGTVAGVYPYLFIHLPYFVLALFVSYYIRPTVREILQYREASMASARHETAAVAAVAARNDRLDWIEATAGPWLEKIAASERLTDDQREECRLLEAGIRDHIRAPGLTGPEIDDVVRRARERGVDVVLLDDGALAAAPRDSVLALQRIVADHIDLVDTGKVTARIVPPGREESATFLSVSPEGMARKSFTASDLARASSTPAGPPDQSCRSA